MPNNIFQETLARAARAGITPYAGKSLDWFREQMANVRTTPRKILTSEDLNVVKTPRPGRMYMYTYDPLHKATLPYYDTFPLIFMIETYSDGFLGLNLHYLPLSLRAKLMDALYELTNNKRYDESTKLRLSYKVLQSASKYKYFAPCIKRYLIDHVRSKFVEITADKWDAALFMPLHRFKKASAEKVWRDARNGVR